MQDVRDARREARRDELKAWAFLAAIVIPCAAFWAGVAYLIGALT